MDEETTDWTALDDSDYDAVQAETKADEAVKKPFHVAVADRIRETNDDEAVVWDDESTIVTDRSASRHATVWGRRVCVMVIDVGPEEV